VNSYSKAFDKLVEHRCHTPSLPAPELQALLDAKTDIVIVDARRFDNYNTMSIPAKVNVPGAELVFSAPVLAPWPDTTIIVNCAGQTRSLIGTATPGRSDSFLARVNPHSLCVRRAPARTI
jgi:hypothetical protein